MSVILLVLSLLVGYVLAMLLHAGSVASQARFLASQLEILALQNPGRIWAYQAEWDAANLRAYARRLERWTFGGDK